MLTAIPPGDEVLLGSLQQLDAAALGKWEACPCGQNRRPVV